MSEIREILRDVIAGRAGTFGDTVVHGRTGTRFSAEIEEVSDIESNMLLGRDARESVIFHVADRRVAGLVGLNDEIEALGETFRVLRRTDNPSSPQVDFGAMKVTGKDE